jgi:hypothetical protein
MRYDLDLNRIALSNNNLSGKDRIVLANAAAEMVTLRNALQPFAEEAAKWRNVRNETIRPICARPDPEEPDNHDEASFTVGDLKRASELLKK